MGFVPLDNITAGKVASLHLHPAKPGEPLVPVMEIQAQEGGGIVNDMRVFGRKDRKGEPSKRQVSLIGREQIAQHATALGLASFPPGAVRSNIETEGIDLVSYCGNFVQVGGAVLFFYEPRTPCPKMDLVAPGLQGLMAHARQGVMAKIVSSGIVRVGDKIQPLKLL